MPQQTKIFRVFISSTFTDMKEERNILQSDVFPRLEKFCLQNNAKFQAIDLRWGINEKNQLNQKTLQTCLNEVARCQKVSPKPNFLILLGDKYGWQPIPERIPEDEMKQIIPLFSDSDKKIMYWDEEDKNYRGWYRRDTNSNPTKYELLERTEKYVDYDEWEPIEKSIRRALRNAVEKLDYPDSKRIKYFTSATHQEIINGVFYPPGKIDNPNKHVFAFERIVANLPQDSTASDYIDLDGEKRDTYSVKQLERLKTGKEGKGGLKKRLGEHYKTYNGTWDDKEQKVKIVDIQKFADDIYNNLLNVIKSQVDAAADKDDLNHEVRLHKDFKNNLVQHFKGRSETLNAIKSYLNGPESKTLSLIGKSGSGKSSVMAKVVWEFEKTNPNSVISYRFLGTSSNSSNVISMMHSVAGQIANEFNIELEDLAGEGNENALHEIYGMTEVFKKCLALATPEKPVVVFLDALDQLSDTDNARQLPWLPKEIPENVKFIVSSLPELEGMLTETTKIQLPLLEKTESEKILETWLKSISRTLTPEQFDEILLKEKSDLPIYLKLAFEQAKEWKSFQKTQNLSETVEGIITEFIEKLEAEHGGEFEKILDNGEKKKIPSFVEHVICYMLCGRYQGLAENEILDILVFDDEFWEVFRDSSHEEHKEELKKAKKIPLAVWSRLYLDLEPFLTERDADGVPIFTFFHRQFNEVLQNKYGLKENKKGD